MKNILVLSGAFALVSLLTSSCHHAKINKSAESAPTSVLATKDTLIHKSPNDDRTYAAITLPNGLQAVLVSDPSLENSAAVLALPVGSAQDPAEFQGLAHYLEHMLLLGTEKYPEPDGLQNFVQLNGGSNNATTYSDKTYYQFQVNENQFDNALDRFSDYFKSPTFNKIYADKQRHAVDSEWSMQRGQYLWGVWRLEEITANQKNPHSQFSIGNLATLSDKPSNILQENVQAFYARYYSANIMHVTLVGKQSIAELKALAQKHFSSIVNKNIAVPTVTEPGLTNAELAQHIHFKPIQDVKSVFTDFPIKSNKHLWRLKPNDYVLNLINSQEAGTLIEQLQRRGLVTYMGAFIKAENYGPDGFLRIEAELTEKGLSHQDDVIAATFAYIDLLKREGLNERYYLELKALRQKDFLNSNKLNPIEQAIQLSVAQLNLPVENLLNADSIYDRYDEMVIKDLMAQLDPKKVRVWSISNQEVANKEISFFAGKYAVNPIAAETFNRWNEKAKNYQFNVPPLNNLFTSEPAPIVDNVLRKPTAVISRPGVEAFLVQPTFYREDKGLLSLEINTPIGKKSAKNVVLSNLLSNMFMQQNASLIDRAARASLEVSINPSATNSPEINLAGYTSKHAFILNQLITKFALFHVTPQEFSVQLDSYRQSLNNKSTSRVDNQLFQHLFRVTDKSSWRNEELLAAAKMLVVQDLVNYHQAIKKDPLLRIFASGNYSEEDVKSMALAAATILPGKRLPDERVVPQVDIPQTGQWKHFSGSVDLTDSGLLQAWFSENDSDASRAQMEVLDALYYPAVYSQLRTTEQLGYVVDGGYTKVADTLAFFMAVQSSNSDLNKIKSRMDYFRKTYIETLKAVSEADVEKIKQAKIASLVEKPTDFNTEASHYAREFWRATYTFDERERRIAAFERVTKTNLIELYERLLLSDKSSGVLVQLRGTHFKDAAFAPLH